MIIKNILIGDAWRYANGTLHIGHFAALLPDDVIERNYRLKGDQVFYVSGSDCHGTPGTNRERISNWLNLNNKWKPQCAQDGFKVSDISILFERLNKKLLKKKGGN